MLGELAVPLASAAVQEQDVVRLGISNYATPTPHEVLYTRTIETLRAVVAPRRLQVRYYSPGELSDAINRDRLDFVFGSAGFYRRTALETGNRELVSIVTSRYPDPNHSDGAAIVVRADRGDLKNLEALQGKRLSANRPFTFTGFLVPMGAVAAMGADPEDFFGTIIFKGEGRTMQGIARDVLEGRADVGFLRLCMLETLENDGLIAKGALRVVNDMTASGEACRRSTPLYPGWTISTTPRVRPELSRAVTLALLSQPAVGDGLRWAIATDYQSVDDLYRMLRMGPYEYLRQWTLERFVQHYWAWLAAALLATAAVALFAFVQNARLRRSMARERLLEEQSRAAAEKMDAMQKVWTVGELSSVIAHELRQPLASIAVLSRGVLLFFDRGEADAGRVKSALQTIESQALRASDIVEKVRSYARTPAGKREVVDLSECIRHAVGVLQATGRDPRHVLDLPALASVPVMADRVEIELAIVNLMKNALEAVAGEENPRVCVRLQVEAGTAVLAVSDNGPALSMEQLEGLRQPLKSTKSEGLGLGLAIVQAIAERHGGRLDFARAKDGAGLVATIRIPTEET